MLFLVFWDENRIDLEVTSKIHLWCYSLHYCHYWTIDWLQTLNLIPFFDFGDSLKWEIFIEVTLYRALKNWALITAAQKYGLCKIACFEIQYLRHVNCLNSTYYFSIMIRIMEDVLKVSIALKSLDILWKVWKVWSLATKLQWKA